MEGDFTITELSEEGQTMMKDNGFTLEFFKMFSEEDIHEFKNVRDRFIIRQIVKKHTTTTSIQVCSPIHIDTESEMDSSVNSDFGGNVSTSTPLKPTLLCSPDFTADQLLERKGQHGSNTPAQTYVNNLLKDSAKYSNIWKKAPRLSEIPNRKRDVFMDSFKRGAPQMNNPKHLSQVWKRLGESLQNRRKYINDMLVGKRTPKPKKRANSKTHHTGSSSSQSDLDTTALAISNDQDNKVYIPGENVLLTNKNKDKILAKGIFLAGNDMFCEVVIQDVNSAVIDVYENEHDTSDLELPRPCGEYTNLCKEVNKNVVTWKYDRLVVQTAGNSGWKKKLDNTGSRSSAKPGNDAKSYSRNEKDVKLNSDTTTREKANSVEVRAKSSQSISKCKSGHHLKLNESKKKQIPVHKTAKPATITKDNSDDLKLNSKRVEKKQIHKTLPVGLDKAAVEKRSNFCTVKLSVYEWSRGELYIGAEMERSSCNIELINCRKPVGAVKNNRLVLPEILDVGMITLNKQDRQTNPDKRYAVYSTEMFNLDALSEMFIIQDELAFLENLRKAFVDYV